MNELVAPGCRSGGLRGPSRWPIMSRRAGGGVPHRVVLSPGSTGRLLHERHRQFRPARPTRRQFVEDRGGRGRRGVRRAGDRARPEPEREAQHRDDRHRAAAAATTSSSSRAENIVVLCDVYEPAVDRAATEHSQARRYRDFRRVFDHANDFDAVVVSTTEHTHAFATLPALQLGKHVYCEKPLTYNIAEARDHPRGRRQDQGGDPDGQPEPRQRQLPPRHRADPDRRHRPGHRGARLGVARLGPAAAGGGQAEREGRLTG